MNFCTRMTGLPNILLAPISVWLARVMSLAVTVTAIRYASEVVFLPWFRIFFGLLVLPVSLLIFVISWCRGVRPQKWLAIYVVLVPVFPCFGLAYMKYAVYRNLVWSDVFWLLVLVMTVPIIAAVDLIRGCDVQRYYSRRDNPPNCQLVAYDNCRVSLFEDGSEVWFFLWRDIARIGYRTTDEGPWFDDHFLVFKTKADPPLFYDISLSWGGALELSDYVKTLPDTLIPLEGTLANVTICKSVTVWPAIHSGEPME